MVFSSTKNDGFLLIIIHILKRPDMRIFLKIDKSNPSSGRLYWQLDFVLKNNQNPWLLSYLLPIKSIAKEGYFLRRSLFWRYDQDHVRICFLSLDEYSNSTFYDFVDNSCGQESISAKAESWLAALSASTNMLQWSPVLLFTFYDKSHSFNFSILIDKDI